MAMAYIVYSGLWAVAGAVTWLAAVLFKRGRRAGRSVQLHRFGGLVASVTVAALLIVNVNVLPSWLHQAGLLRTLSTARNPVCPPPDMPTSTVDPRNGNEAFSPRPCSVEWVANVDAPTTRRPPTAPRDCLPVRRGTRPTVVCYSLATIEFDESGKVVDQAQPAILLRHASTLVRSAAGESTLEADPAPGDVFEGDGPQLYVIVYVHGWRHSAAAGDSDVRRLRVVAANAARNLAERCQFAKRNCRTQVLAVYASWPGATTFWDSAPCDRYARPASTGESETCLADSVGGALNGLSFTPSKAISDAAGRGVVRALTTLRKRLSAVATNRMLLLGHSLGGNLLLSGLLGLPIQSDGNVGPADLTVLLNPATEASKWRRFATRFDGISWPNVTPPRVAYLTAPCAMWPADWHAPKSKELLNDALKGRCDNIVDTYFTWSQRVVTGTWLGAENEDVVGAGHTKPLVDTSGVDLDHTHTNWMDLNVGTAFDAAGAPSRATTYKEARSNSPSCFVEPSFLYCARERGRNNGRPFKACGGKLGPFTSKWDFGSVRNTGTLGRVMDDQPGGTRQANVQLASGGFRGDRNLFSRISPAWGIRSGQSAVRLHGGVASAPVLCLFNKLLLDDAARRPNPGSPKPGTFEAIYRGEITEGATARRTNAQ